MKMLSREALSDIARWMYRNARPLDLARWRFFFEDGCAEDVLRALAAHQNGDGGFGHAVDCDNWNPNSTPYNATVAIGVFRELGMADPTHPMIRRMLDYLGATEFFSPDVGWHFTVPTNDEHPHAPWWNWSIENNRANGFHATGALAGYILRCCDVGTPAHDRALSISRTVAEKILARGAHDMHEVGAYLAWLAGARAANLALDLDAIGGVVKGMVNQSIERDPVKWPLYSIRPSRYIDSPESPYYPGNEAVVAAELDYMLETREPDGIWPISWQWDAYPRQFAIAERWWRGCHAVNHVAHLKAFGRVE